MIYLDPLTNATDKTAIADSNFEKLDALMVTSGSGSGVSGNTRNLSMQSTSTTAGLLVSDEVVLKTTSGTSLVVRNVSLTIDITVGVALNGYETGAARAASHWYYVWLITDDGTNVRFVLEDAGAGDGALPGGPDLTGAAFAGYTYMALMGQIRLNATGSGEIVPFMQRDRVVWFDEVNIFTAKLATAANTYQLLSGAELTAFRAAIPPTAGRCSGTMGNSTNTMAAITIAACSAAGTLDTAQLGAQTVTGAQGAGVYNSFWIAGPFDAPVRGGGSRNIQWKSLNTTVNNRLNVSSYTF